MKFTYCKRYAKLILGAVLRGSRHHDISAATICTAVLVAYKAATHPRCLCYFTIGMPPINMLTVNGPADFAGCQPYTENQRLPKSSY
eukprot:6214572-Pleurochrysis_carterae.AAC.1